MKLRVHLFDELAGVVEVGKGPVEAMDLRPAAAELSLAWRGRLPEAFELRRWLDNLLPENGAREAFVERAMARLLATDADPTLHGSAEHIWGNVEADYPGAVRFARDDEPLVSQGSYFSVDEREIGERLLEADAVATRGRKGVPRERAGRVSSLSGMRGKIGLTSQDAEDGSGAPTRYAVATGAALDTWIAKHEHRAAFPGEAGVEAVCQRALRLLGVPAARTCARVFAGAQTVLSERSDRVVEAGRVKRRHFEEFASAAGWFGALKYQGDTEGEPGFDHAFRLLPDDRKCDLAAALAGSVGLGHGDLHRRNFGFGRDADGTPRLAPMYDVSSAAGLQEPPLAPVFLALGIAGQQDTERVYPRTWLELARQGGMDGERMIHVVTETIANLPDAIAKARRIAREEDENVEQAAVDRRVECVQAYAHQSDRQWKAMLERARRMRLPGIPEAPSTLGRRRSPSG